MHILQPSGWAKPRGYSNGVATSGRLVFVSRQIGWDEQCQFRSADLVGQARQALQNVLTVLAEAGGRPEHITRMVWYMVDKREYLESYKELCKVYRELMGEHYPAMTAIQVAALLEDMARVEIEAIAVIP